MFVCKECGRKFKDKNALGGHVSSAHRQIQAMTNTDTGRPAEPQPQPANAQEHSQPQPQAEAPQGQAAGAGVEGGIREHIRELMRDGFTAKQIKERWGYARQTVDEVFRENIVPEGKPEGWGMPAVRKQTEVLELEPLLRAYADGTDNEQAELKGMMKLRGAMLLVMELANIQEKFALADAKRMEPLLKILREGREELDAAAERAKGSSFEMAQQAAQSAVGGAIQYWEDKEARKQQETPSQPPKTVDDTMAQRLNWAVGKMTDLMWNMMQQRMFPQEGSGVPQGWEYQGPPSQSD